MFKFKPMANGVSVESLTMSNISYLSAPLVKLEANYDHPQLFQAGLNFLAFPDQFVSLTFNYNSKDGQGLQFKLTFASKDDRSVTISAKGKDKSQFCFTIENCAPELLNLVQSMQKLIETLETCAKNNCLKNELLLEKIKELMEKFITITRVLATTQTCDANLLSKVSNIFNLETANFENLLELENVSSPVKKL